MFFLGVISVPAGPGTNKDNSNTATPFTMPQGARFVLQPDTAGIFAQVLTQAGGAMAQATAFKLATADALVPISTQGAQQFVGIFNPTAGVVNVKVFQTL